MARTSNSFSARTLVLLTAASLVAGGCAAPLTKPDSNKQLANVVKKPEWLKKPSWPWSKKEEVPEPYPYPVKLASTWTPDVLVQDGKTPTRGFGGRLFFFDEATKTVPVEGTLTVHGFEIGRDGRDSEIRPFKFTPEQFTRHFGQSDFGASYSIWIPWDAAGGPEKRISLVPTFKTAEGKVVQGNPTTIVLPGAKSETSEQIAARKFSPQYHKYRDALTEDAQQSKSMLTKTIRRRTATPDGKATIIRDELSGQIASVVAHDANAGGDESTPFIDVSMTPKPPTVMAASAEIPNQPATSHVRTTAGRTTTAPTVPAPRRLPSPTRSQY